MASFIGHPSDRRMNGRVYEIPDGVTSVDRYEFSGCESLTALKITNTKTYIANGAFNGCPKLLLDVAQEIKPKTPSKVMPKAMPANNVGMEMGR